MKVITLKDIHHAYGQNVIYRGMDFQAERGQRIVLAGPNGAGKSTLLKILAGVVHPQQGVRELGHNTQPVIIPNTGWTCSSPAAPSWRRRWTPPSA